MRIQWACFAVCGAGKELLQSLPSEIGSTPHPHQVFFLYILSIIFQMWCKFENIYIVLNCFYCPLFSSNLIAVVHKCSKFEKFSILQHLWTTAKYHVHGLIYINLIYFSCPGTHRYVQFFYFERAFFFFLFFLRMSSELPRPEPYFTKKKIVLVLLWGN